jgi:hypothetical protein
MAARCACISAIRATIENAIRYGYDTLNAILATVLSAIHGDIHNAIENAIDNFIYSNNINVLLIFPSLPV